MLTVDEQLKQIFQKRFEGEPLIKSSSVQLSEGRHIRFDDAVTPIEVIKDVQEILRPIFGKDGSITPSIGGHPDYNHLAGSHDVEYGSITTLFMDLESSTRLGILYSPEDVYKIKNTFIRMAIEVIKSFDGHIHRIMGDAVMAFFGSKSTTEENGVLDALNCGAVLVYFVKNAVIPKLEEMGFTNSEFGIRVGVDFGSKKNVLWSSYGFAEMEEVTATSFFVDVASKLQHLASRNNIMIGQSLVEYIDIHDDLLSTKKITDNGTDVNEPYLVPNITKADGNPINYKKFHFDWKKHLKMTPFPIKEEGGGSFLPVIANNFRISIEVWDEDKQTLEGTYSPGSIFIDKRKQLKFTLELLSLPQLPYTVSFSVENHGKDAYQAGQEEGREPYNNHTKVYTIANAHQHKPIVHWEHTLYRGIHYMCVKVASPTRTLHNVVFTVFIK